MPSHLLPRFSEGSSQVASDSPFAPFFWSRTHLPLGHSVLLAILATSKTLRRRRRRREERQRAHTREDQQVSPRHHALVSIFLRSGESVIEMSSY